MSCKHVFILFHSHVLQYCTYFVLKSVLLPSKCSDYTEVHPLWITFCLYFPISKISFNFMLTLLMILWVFKINRNLLWRWITSFCNFTITVAFTELQYFLKIKSLTSHPTRIALKTVFIFRYLCTLIWVLDLQQQDTAPVPKCCY